MALENWKNRLVSEIRQNKLKAALLLVALAVACYYWIPLMGRLWRRSPQPASVTTAPTAAVSQAKGEEGVSDGSAFNWETFQQWKSQCSWMSSRSWPLALRDPFRSAVELQTQAADATSQPATGLAEGPTPAEAGLVLRSILCSPRGNWANINGQMYRVGDAVNPVDSAGQQARFRIVFIGPDHVDLERDGQWYRVPFDEQNEPPPERLSISRNIQ